MLHPAILVAQLLAPNPIIGTWNISFAAGTRIEDGQPTTIMGTGKLTIEQIGDSLIAQLVANPIEGRPARPPARLAAAAGDGAVVFVSTSTATVNINGNEHTAISVSTWSLSATGDTLEGTVERRLEGFDAPSAGAQPVTGTRSKS